MVRDIIFHIFTNLKKKKSEPKNATCDLEKIDWSTPNLSTTIRSTSDCNTNNALTSNYSILKYNTLKAITLGCSCSVSIYSSTAFYK